MIERLPTPWGLVRLGVAPDHPNIKAVSKAFERIARSRGLPLLRQRRGRARRDARGARRGSTTPSSTRSARRPTAGSGFPARTCPARGPRPSSSPGTTAIPTTSTSSSTSRGERAVVIGNGNVAVDVARMLALTDEELAPTDTTDAAIAAIVGSGIREIVMLGRRGPAQAAFTPPELQELGELAGADVVVDPADLELDPASEAALEADRATRAAQRRASCASTPRASPRASRRRLLLRFCVSPVAILGEGRVEAIEVVRNELVAGDDGQIRAVPTDEMRGDPVRPRPPQRRLPRRRAAGPAVPRGARRDPERGRPRDRRRRRGRCAASTAPAGSSAARAA